MFESPPVAISAGATGAAGAAGAAVAAGVAGVADVLAIASGGIYLNFAVRWRGFSCKLLKHGSNWF